MYRNDLGTPYLALLASAALFLSGWLDGRLAAQLAEAPLDHLTVGQIAMFAFAMLLLLYAAIGALSVWFEGRELRPAREVQRPGGAAVAAGLLGALALVVLSGTFTHLIARELVQGTTAPRLEGGLVAAIFVVAAFLLTLHKRFVMAREVWAEDEDDEVPW